VRFYAALSVLRLHKDAPLVLYCYETKQYKPTQEVQYEYIIHECRGFYQANFPLSSAEAFDDADTHCLWDHSFPVIGICPDSAPYNDQYKPSSYQEADIQIHRQCGY
jgi:hypothetical protein